MAIRNYKRLSPQLGKDVYIDGHALVIGDVVLGNDCSVWPMAVIRGDVHSIRIGHRTNIQDGSVLHVTHAGKVTAMGHSLTLGDDVTVGHQATLHGCKIGNRVLIGMKATVIDGACLHDDIIIGASSLVPPGKTLVSGFLYVGNPVQQIRPLKDKERLFLSYSASHYVSLKNDYLQMS